MQDDTSEIIGPAIDQGAARARTRFYWVLILVSLAATIVSIPFVHALSKDPRLGHLFIQGSLARFVFLALIECLLLSLPLVWVGLRFGRATGLGAPLFEAWAARRPLPSEAFRRAIGRGTQVGLAVGVVMVVSSPLIEPFTPELTIDYPSWWRGILASAGAGVREEIWLRFGAMTALARLGMALCRVATPWASIIWTANVLAAVLFGAMHLPQAAALTALTPAVVIFVLAGNGVAGIAFGWLYWRYGLEAAMVGHFATDIVLHVVAPAIFPEP